VAISSNISVTIKPARAAITTGQTQTYVATVANDTLNQGVTWAVDTFPGGNAISLGTIDASGKYTPPTTGMIGGAHTITATSRTDSSKSVSGTIAVTDLPGVFTYHNDISRTGQNTKEYALTPSLVNTATFQKLFSCTVDAAVYAQPLWVGNLPIGGVTHNVVYVATQHDTVYALDADNPGCQNVWGGPKSLIPPTGETWVTSSDVSCGDLEPDIGIVGTPVIDPLSNTIYIVTKTKATGGSLAYHQRLHALDLATGAEKFSGPTDIQASVSGTGNGSSGGTLNFDPKSNNQRPALLLESGHVIISWASHCDIDPYHGWAISYSASTLLKESVFNASPNGLKAGIWMSGNGPAADGNGNIYSASGNGTWNGTDAYGDSIVKLGPQSGGLFGTLDYFTPTNQGTLDAGDTDLGSGGLVLLPDLTGNPHPHLLLQAGKEGKIYVVNRDNLGHMCTGSCSTGDTQIVQELPGAVGGMFGTPAYWNGTVYFGGSGDNIKAFSVSASATSPLSSNPTSQSSHTFSFPGPTPSVSSNANTNGIVWAVETGQYCTQQSPGCGPAVLHAYDATTLATELWNSTQGAGNTAGNAVKFMVPTVANGKVYLGTRGNDCGPACTVIPSPAIPGELDVYGLLPK
jgi:hypothetical protein